MEPLYLKAWWRVSDSVAFAFDMLNFHVEIVPEVGKVRWRTKSMHYPRNARPLGIDYVYDRLVVTEKCDTLILKNVPYKWHATTRAKSSCHAIPLPGCPRCWSIFHRPWNQWEPKIPPKPWEHEASVCKCREYELTQAVDRKKLVRFQLEMKACLMRRSLKNPELSLIWWWGWETLRVNSIMRWKKGRPGGTTLQAKFRVPISTCSSFKVQDFFWLKKSQGSLDTAETSIHPGWVQSNAHEI